MRSRRLAFAVLATVCVVAAGSSAAVAVLGAKEEEARAAREIRAARPHAESILASGRPYAVVRMLDRAHGATYGRIAIAPLAGGNAGERVLAGPSCQRVAVAAGKGLCLDVLGTEMSVKVMDADLNVRHVASLPGIPSRARISPDGRWGRITAFVVGHAYTSPGEFSTAATIIDLRTGRPVADLEKDFTVTDGGNVVDARDRNYWGLTFAADGDTFFATLATGGDTWLIKGSIKARRAETIHRNVECPSLSPDGARIAYKKAIARNPSVWRFHVLDLATVKETALSETRSVDDQLSWLDDRHVLYGAEEKIWMADADGSGRPKVWMAAADSPTVQAGAASSS
jgi:hypothetical protein